MYKSISLSELEKLLNESDIHLVDVREADEYEAGHIPGASHLPLSGFPENIDALSKDKKHYLICASGGRSGMAADYLSQEDYDVVNVEGGMMKWQGAVE